jgi:hypothetical protein
MGEEPPPTTLAVDDSANSVKPAAKTPEVNFLSDPVYKAALARMDDLDAQVGYGEHMDADVERTYRLLILSHEPPKPSPLDKTLAIAGRIRMMDAFASAGDRNKLALMAIETATKHPEIFVYRQFLAMSSAADLQLNPKFKALLEKAPEDARNIYGVLAELREHEKRIIDEATTQMQIFDQKMFDPVRVAEGIQDYWDLVDKHESVGRPTRAARRVAFAARMRIIDQMFTNGAEPGGTLDTMLESMNMYPEMTHNRLFLSIAANYEAAKDPAWMDAFKRNGGDVSKLAGQGK